MKKISYALMACFMTVILMLSLSGCTIYNLRSVVKTPTKYKYAVNDNLKISGRDEQLLENPDRGFRGETYITLGANRAYPGDEVARNPYEEFDKELNYEGANARVVQGYVYLVEYYNQDLPASALDELKNYFEYVQKSGVKLLLRFAYEFSSSDKRGPTTEQIVRHCAQLKTWFNDNLALTYDVVYAMQLGMIGLWGEGHGNVNPHKIKDIIKAVADMTPEKLTIMIRTPALLSQVPSKYRKRFTVHDDFLVGIDHSWGMLSFKHAQYKQLCNISRTSISDGEMPWGRDKTVDNIEPLIFLDQIIRYGLTTLSIKHNYMESEEYPQYELYKWRNEYLTSQQLTDNKLPYNPKMLIDDKISIFDYINYHLGYQIALSDYSLNGNVLKFMLTNYGFAAPLGYNMEILVNGKVIKTISAAEMKIYQFSQYKVNIKLDSALVNAKIGIRWISERDSSTFKVANDIPYVDGINYIS